MNRTTRRIDADNGVITKEVSAGTRAGDNPRRQEMSADMKPTTNVPQTGEDEELIDLTNETVRSSYSVGELPDDPAKLEELRQQGIRFREIHREYVGLWVALDDDLTVIASSESEEELDAAVVSSRGQLVPYRPYKAFSLNKRTSL